MLSKDELKAVGLGDAEAEIYLILLQIGEGLGSEIARRARISRPHVYGILDKLLARGLASYVVKHGKKYYKPADPEKMHELVKEREQALENLLPRLKELYGAIRPRTRIEIYEGKEGAKTLLNDIIRTGKDIVVWGASARLEDLVPAETKRYLRLRAEKGIHARQLYARGTKVLPSPLSKFKPLPPEFAAPSTTLVYGDKVAIVLWIEIPTVVLIANKALAESYRKHFELMWKAG